MCIELAKIAEDHDNIHLIGPLVAKARFLAQSQHHSTAPGNGSPRMAAITEIEKRLELRVAVDALPTTWSGGDGVR